MPFIIFLKSYEPFQILKVLQIETTYYLFKMISIKQNLRYSILYKATTKATTIHPVASSYM